MWSRYGPLFVILFRSVIVGMARQDCRILRERHVCINMRDRDATNDRSRQHYYAQRT